MAFAGLGGIMTKKPAVYTLSGSSGTPNAASDTQTFPDAAQAGWTFRLDGRVQRIQNTSSFFNEGVEWTDEYPATPVDTWIRATNNSGSNPDNGPTLGTWHKLGGGANRTWTWDRSAPGTSTGSLKIDIATDSGGSTIVATGYYGGTATQNAA